MKPRPGEDPWDIVTDAAGPVEEGMALALGAVCRIVYEDVKAKLPPGTHFAIVIDIPGTDTDPDGRIAALSTSRSHMAPLCEEWALNVMGRG